MILSISTVGLAIKLATSKTGRVVMGIRTPTLKEIIESTCPQYSSNAKSFLST